MVVSATPTDELIALGLGSCIGLAIVDRTAAVAGLAHIVLPKSHPGGERGKFADTAVPQLVRGIREAGGVVRRMEAAIAGGARMFEMSGGLDIGSRNEHAVRAALAAAKIALRASETGGNQGRTIRIRVGEGLVTVRAAGQAPVTLLGGTHHGPADGVNPPATRAAAVRAAGAEHAGTVRRLRPAVSTTGAQS
ncbi:MAG TPA: chemotaxis protein CheD [Solirubrobacteraceae bacterium]|jgi:chemotaxis protein CheD|nr:chemotaxis protein CheD [Solirubrobacteraceae bacterium]